MKPAPILTGLAGAAIGAAVWYWYETSGSLRDATWGPLLLGVLAGIGARIVAEPIRANFRRGAIIAVIAAVAMFATQKGVSLAVEREFDQLVADSPLVVVDPVVGDTDASDDSVAATTDASEPATDTAEPATDDAGAAGVEPPQTADDATAAQDAAPQAAGDSDQQRAVKDATIANRTALEGEYPESHSPPPLFLALSYAVGILLAYVLGKGPALQREPEATMTASAT